MFAMGPALFKQPSSGGTVPEAISIWGKLIAWYTFNDTTVTGGSSLVDSVAAKNLVVSATGTMTSVSGKIGNAVQGDGTVYAACSDSTAHQLTGDLAMFGWIKTTSTATAKYIFNKWAGAANYGLTTGSSDGTKIRMLAFVGSTQQVTSVTSINDGAFHFVGGQRNGTSLQVFINNPATADASTTIGSGAMTASNVPLTAFAQANTPAGSQFTGTMDEWGLCNAALTSAEWAYLYNSGSGRSFAQLKADSGH